MNWTNALFRKSKRIKYKHARAISFVFLEIIQFDGQTSKWNKYIKNRNPSIVVDSASIARLLITTVNTLFIYILNVNGLIWRASKISQKRKITNQINWTIFWSYTWTLVMNTRSQLKCHWVEKKTPNTRHHRYQFRTWTKKKNNKLIKLMIIT